MTAEVQRLRKANKKLSDALLKAAEKVVYYSDEETVEQALDDQRYYRELAKRYTSDWTPLNQRVSIKRKTPLNHYD